MTAHTLQAELFRQVDQPTAQRQVDFLFGEGRWQDAVDYAYEWADANGRWVEWRRDGASELALR